MEKKYTNNSTNNRMLFTYNPERPWDGIFTYYRENCGGNPVTNHLMTVTKSSSLAGDPREVLDTTSSDNNWTNEETNANFVFHFLNHSFHMTHYRIRSVHFETGWAHLKQWVIEGSDDGNNYTVIDKRTDDNHLNGNGNEFTFECNNDTKQSFSYFRLRMNGNNHRNNLGLGIRRIEFYGDSEKF